MAKKLDAKVTIRTKATKAARGREGTKSDRIFEILESILRAKAPIPYETFRDPKWGCEKTVKRILGELNSFWNLHWGQNLFDIIGENGEPVTRGVRFIRRTEGDFHVQGALAFAVVPAFFGFLRLMKSTIMESHYEEVYEKIKKCFKRGDQLFLDRLNSKFYYFGKGMKKFDAAKAEIFEEIYDALLQERLLWIKVASDSGPSERIIKPLTLLMFNSGLYLVALRHDQDPATKKPYQIRLEGILEAESLKKEKFDYPTDYHPEQLYEGEFGLMRGSNDKLMDVELKFIDDPGIKRYVRERTWTKWDKFEEKRDGTLVLKMKASDLAEIKAFVLSCGEKAEVLQPVALRDEVKETVKKLMQVYRQAA